MRSLSLKLVLAFLAVSLIGTALTSLYVARTTTTRFDQYVIAQFIDHSAERYGDYHRIRGSWDGVGAELRSLAQDRMMQERMRRPGDAMMAPAVGRELPHALVLADQDGRVIVPAADYALGVVVPRAELLRGVPIEVNGKRVGTLMQPRDGFYQVLRRDRFLTDFYRAMVIGSASATMIALVLGVILAGSLTSPLRELTAATQAMSRGDLSQEIPVRSQDELGQLTHSFNQMSSDLARAQELRRQMTADIAHELRTPLSLILGHSEALSDGVLPPSAETFSIIYDEAQRLTRLVDDLRTLSLSDAGELPLHLERVSPAELLERAATSHQQLAAAQQVVLTVQASSELPGIHVDPDRLNQVLRNLLDNALRYTPPGGGIVLAARVIGDELRVLVQDSGPGIPPEDISLVFDRFYTGDRSRHRGESGSGLGLAIARSIVEGHGGRIWAESIPGQGATFVVALPLADS